MDTIIKGHQDDRGSVHDLNLVDTSNWETQSHGIANNNSTLLYIAVEYVKDYKIDHASATLPVQSEPYSEFDTHVSPLDPNMSSVARYSPVYNESSTEFNPVVIHQLVTQDDAVENEQYVNLNSANLENMPTVLCNSEVNSQYLQMVNQNSSIGSNDSTEGLRLVSDREQEVELLITDEATGISYSVNAQDILVERCLEDDRQLLEALAPDPLLESDLLTLDDSTLKCELTDDIDISSNRESEDMQGSHNYIGTLVNEQEVVIAKEFEEYKTEIRKSKRGEVANPEEQLLSCVYTIIDKPVLSRARATLPESYLIIGKVDEENAVFAKKIIPRRSRFGPLEGVLSLYEAIGTKQEPHVLLFLLESDNIIYRMDVSDENASNWMGFVRKADTYEEQNLVVTLENGALYFTTTSNILPKQELKIGYSCMYAKRFDLSVLQPVLDNSWPCFECPESFSTSEDLNRHLIIHEDEEKDENAKPKRKLSKTRKKLKRYEMQAVECTMCNEVFYQYNHNTLKNHFEEKRHQVFKGDMEDYFSVVMLYKCPACSLAFRMDPLLGVHKLAHDPESGDHHTNHVCPACQKKCPTRRQLIMHVAQHAVSHTVAAKDRGVRCPVCSKGFALRERLQKHMLVHGAEENKPLPCKTCNKRFLTNSALACHLKTHLTGKKVFECPMCNEGFEHVLKLKLHVPKHSVNNSYTCPYCNKLFKQYSMIRKHIRAFHCERKHNCQHCTKVFPTLDKLRMHLLRHSNHREFLCSDCGKQFKRKDKLKEHCKKHHEAHRQNAQRLPERNDKKVKVRTFTPKVEPTAFHRFIYKCHACLVGFKRRGMLVNHLAKRHPDIRPESVPELNLPILQTTRDYYCQYCDKVYKSSSKRKSHILKNHPGAALPLSNRKQGVGSIQEVSAGQPNPTFSQTVGSITTSPQNCKWCHKQYASKAKLLQHQRKKHMDEMRTEGNKNRDEESIMEEPKASSPKESNDITEFDKVEVDNIISSEFDDYNLEDDSDLCHLSINENDGFIQRSELENPNSHLYQLLTTNNALDFDAEHKSS